MFKPSGGQKLDLGEGFIIHLPPIPDKSQIINYSLPKEEQIWTRQPLPQFYNERIQEEEYKQSKELDAFLAGKIKKLAYADPVLERYRRREWHRRSFGVWVMINGVPEYLTEDHFFYLQYGKADHPDNNGYPFYYKFSRDNFYIRKWCKQNPKSLGYMFIGPRGCGKSAEEIASMLNEATRIHNFRAAIQTKHFEDDSKKIMIQSKTIPMFNALPNFFKPKYSHGTNAQESLVFTRASVRGSGASTMDFGPDYELNSTIFAAMPGEKALDGETLKKIFESEIGKTDPKKVADIHVRHDVNLKCVFRNHRKIGLLAKESTVEEMGDGGDECFKLWKDSDLKKMDNNGYTISKIHRHLISALDTDTSLEEYIDQVGKNWGPPCDKYGNVDRTIANIKIQNDLDAVKNDLKKMSSRMRKSPRNETEAFIKDQSRSVFNIQILSNRLNQIRNEMTKPPYVKGNLYWLKEQFGAVGFMPDEHAGRFNFAWFPDEFVSTPATPDDWKILNNFGREVGYDRQGKQRMLPFPKNSNKFKISTDPIQFSRTKDPRASKSSIHAFRMYDSSVDYGVPKAKWQSHNYLCEYVCRPDNPMTYCEDLAMLCFFLGAKVMPEKNVKTINTYFEQNGLDKFLAYPNDFVEGIGLEVQTESTDAGMASTTEVINEYVIELIQFINEHGHRMPFDITISDWMEFDPSPGEITKHDPTVSSGFCLIHMRKIHKEDLPPEGKISDWFDGGDNSGVSGRLLSEEEMEFSQ